MSQMINHKYKIIYVRVAKTASESFITLLRGSDAQLKRVDVSSVWSPPGVVWDENHYPLSSMKEVIQPQNYENYFKFGFVRNPWDRALSQYKYGLWFYSHHTPPEYRKNKQKWPKPLRADFKHYVMGNTDWPAKYRPQWEFLEGCDFIGKFENLIEDVKYICDMNKLPFHHRNFPHEHKTEHKNYTEYYDDEMIQEIGKVFALDIENFGYEFGN